MIKIEKLKNHFPLFVIILLGLLIRSFGLNWDQGAFLHPDERFLIMVSQSLKTPDSWLNYFEPENSNLNPVNVGHKFYVYGSLPVVIHKLLSQFLNIGGFLEITLLGRAISAITDTLIIVLVYKIVEILETPLQLRKKTKAWAALIYAFLVFPIQTSHFFTVDPFLNFFSLLGNYFSLKFLFNPQKKSLISLSGLAFSLALSAKISAIYPLVLSLVLISWAIYKKHQFNFKKTIIPLFKNLLIFFLITYLGLRIFNPGYFAEANIFKPNPSPIFIQNIKTLQTWSNQETWFPPSIQWLNKPWWFTGKNLVLYGLGLPISVFALVGTVEFTKRKLKKSGLWLILAWLLSFILWQSFQFSKTMRYLFVIYPWLTVMAAIGIEHLQNQLNKKRFLVNICFVILVLIWPLAFINIYTQKHTRVEASIWLEKNLPTNTVLLNEYWDDALPVSRNFKRGNSFLSLELHVFDPDSPAKFLQLEKQLNRGEYYILASNRAWASIQENPTRYPQMSNFYIDLLNNELSYKLEKKFTIYPSLKWLGIPLELNDSGAEEAFTVYDHPTVMIFKKQ